MHWSDECKKIYGLAPDVEVDFALFSDQIFPDDKIFVQEAINRAMDFQGDGNYDVEYRVLRFGDKAVRWISAKGKVLFNEDKKAARFIGTVLDITESKLEHESFRKNAERLEHALDSGRLGTYELDIINGELIFSAKVAEIFGLDTTKKMVHQDLKNAIHPDDAGIRREAHNKAAESGFLFYESRIVWPDESIHWVRINGKLVYDEEGTAFRTYGTVLDITEDKLKEQVLTESEALLKESEERFRQMADSVPQHVWTATRDGGLDYVNQRAINYFGKTFDQIVDPGKFEGIHPDDIAVVLKNWRHSLNTIEPFQVEYRLRDKNNIYRWHLGRATPYFNKYNEVKWFGTNTDIVEHKYTEQKKEEFISIASHELKTPITSLKGIVFILKELLEPIHKPQVSKLINTMDNQLNKLTKLVTDLLDVNKLEGQNLQLNKEDFDFSELVKETAEGIQHMSSNYKIIIESNDPVIYNGDKLRLEQVITNLLTNAIKYSPNGNKVIIRYDVTDDNIIFSVQDFGIGIARENVAKLFERFYRVHNSLRFGGLGLGLYISENIIKAHGGNLWIESEIDKGSIFYFLLPRNEIFLGKNIQTDNKSYHADEQVKINYSKDDHWIEANWTGFQNFESVQRGGLIILDIFKKNRCTKVLNDNTNVLGNWSEAAEWAGKIWFSQMQNAGLQYFAWVYSPSTFSQLAAEKSVSIMDGSVTTRFFNDKREAESWLKKN